MEAQAESGIVQDDPDTSLVAQGDDTVIQSDAGAAGGGSGLTGPSVGAVIGKVFAD